MLENILKSVASGVGSLFVGTASHSEQPAMRGKASEEEGREKEGWDSDFGVNLSVSEVEESATEATSDESEDSEQEVDSPPPAKSDTGKKAGGRAAKQPRHPVAAAAPAGKELRQQKGGKKDGKQQKKQKGKKAAAEDEEEQPAAAEPPQPECRTRHSSKPKQAAARIDNKEEQQKGKKQKAAAKRSASKAGAEEDEEEEEEQQVGAAKPQQPERRTRHSGKSQLQQAALEVEGEEEQQQQEVEPEEAAGGSGSEDDGEEQRGRKRPGSGRDKGSKEQRKQRQGSKRKQIAAEEAAEEAPAEEPRHKRQKAAPAAPQQSPQQPQQQQQGRQHGRKQQQQQQAEPAAVLSPKARRQRGAPSPALVAAAAQQIEMSAPPEASADAAAAVGGQPQQARCQQQAHWQEEELEVVASRHAADPAAAASDLLLRRLSQPRSTEAASMQLRPRLQEAHDALLDSLCNTVELGHNNSLLLVGPRGSGKTLVAERVMAAMDARWNTDPRDPVVGVVRLSGVAHAEERTAFREIARQLCEVFKYTFSRAASVGENIEFLRNMLGALASSDKSAIFLLDDFDLFAAKRSKQTLLYNLLDALQTSGMQAAVVGLTCRQDVVEMLEKRVKSRFSHRKVDLSLPTSVLPVSQCSEEQQAQDGAADVLKAMLTLPADFAHPKWRKQWNASVEASAGSAEVKQALQRCINVYPSLRHLANIADWAVGAAVGSGQLAPQGLLAAVERQLAQAKAMVHAIAGLPILDLILLVAAQRLTARGSEDLNFEMAHHEMQRYTVRADHVDTYVKATAGKAWDHLLSQGLMAFVDPRSEARVGSRPYAAAYLLVTREEVEEGMHAHWNCPQSLKEWFKREGGLGTTAGQFL